MTTTDLLACTATPLSTCYHIYLMLHTAPHRKACRQSRVVKPGVSLLRLCLLGEHLDTGEVVHVAVHEHLCGSAHACGAADRGGGYVSYDKARIPVE